MQVPVPLDKTGDGPVSREALYEMVWSEPMLRVAALIGSTDALERFGTWRAPEER